MGRDGKVNSVRLAQTASAKSGPVKLTYSGGCPIASVTVGGYITSLACNTDGVKWHDACMLLGSMADHDVSGEGRAENVVENSWKAAGISCFVA